MNDCIRCDNPLMVLQKSKNAVKCWLWAGIFLVTLMVVIGGITRLTESGLSIVRWKVVSGIIPPFSEKQWKEAFEDYKRFPGYQKLNSTMTLTGFKRIFWWEYIHRLVGRITGIVFIAPFVFFLVKKKFPAWLIKRLMFILFLGLTQGIIGWIMVKSGLHDNPHVSHYRLAMHLCLALLLIAAILWTILELDLSKPVKKLHRKKINLALPQLCLSLIFLQIISGAFVAGLKAGFSYNTFPLMGDELLPAHVFNSTKNFFENGTLMQFTHRWFAWIVTGTIFTLWLKTRTNNFHDRVRFFANVLLLLTTLQVFAGIATLVWRVPLMLGIFHQLVAVLLFGLVVVIIFHFKYNPSSCSGAFLKEPYEK